MGSEAGGSARLGWWGKAILLATAVGAVILAMMAATAGAQQEQQEVRGPVTATGVLEKPAEDNSPDPTPTYRLTDEATGTTYVLISGFVDLEPYVGQRVTITGAPIGGADDAPPALNVTTIEPASGGQTGTEASEVIYGTNAADNIDGRGGHDLLVGLAGADEVLGGPGDDYLVAAYGYWQVAPDAPASRDVMYGGAGDDLIDSADLAGAPDYVECGTGVDLVYAGVEDDVSRDCEYVYRYHGF